jgi:hypothetical protein
MLCNVLMPLIPCLYHFCTKLPYLSAKPTPEATLMTWSDMPILNIRLVSIDATVSAEMAFEVISGGEYRATLATPLLDLAVTTISILAPFGYVTI